MSSPSSSSTLTSPPTTTLSSLVEKVICYDMLSQKGQLASWSARPERHLFHIWFFFCLFCFYKTVYFRFTYPNDTYIRLFFTRVKSSVCQGKDSRISRLIKQYAADRLFAYTLKKKKRVKKNDCSFFRSPVSFLILNMFSPNYTLQKWISITWRYSGFFSSSIREIS